MSSKILRVGDPHVQIKNLKESQKIIDFVIGLAIDNNVDRIEFLGDQFHTHAVVRIEVIDFWIRNLRHMGQETGVDIFLLCGNHDQPGSKEKEQEMNALIAIKSAHPRVRVIDFPFNDMSANISYVPYYSDEDAFLAACQRLCDEGSGELLIAHQTFTGAQYENGFFSEEGIDPALVPHNAIISGHIHKSQQVGKCFYPGTPKWDTMSDANQPKGIYIFDHDEAGRVVNKEFFSTEFVATPIKSYEIKEGDEFPELNPEARNYVVLEGQSAWISKTKKMFKNIANIKVKPTDRLVKVNKQNSETLGTYLEKEFQPIDGVSKEELKQFVGNL
jgi:DNA repair exonuclease SbcCD nuclease subunit